MGVSRGREQKGALSDVSYRPASGCLIVVSCRVDEETLFRSVAKQKACSPGPPFIEEVDHTLWSMPNSRPLLRSVENPRGCPMREQLPRKWHKCTI
jgi:hypothetical protein